MRDKGGLSARGKSRAFKSIGSSTAREDTEDLPAWVSTVEAPIWICDLEGRLTFVNARALSLLGITEDGWRGRLCHEVVRGTDLSGNAHCRQNCRNYRCARAGLPIEPDDMRVGGACSRAAAQGVRIKTISVTAGEGEPHDRRLIHIALEIPEDGNRTAFLTRVAERTPRQDAPPTEPQSGCERLTPRERQVLDLLAQDKNLKQIAAELGISYATARTHVQRILSKLGVHSILEAIARHVLHGR